MKNCHLLLDIVLLGALWPDYKDIWRTGMECTILQTKSRYGTTGYSGTDKSWKIKQYLEISSRAANTLEQQCILIDCNKYSSIKESPLNFFASFLKMRVTPAAPIHIQ